MSTILFWFGVGVLGLIVLMMIPGIRELIKPFIDLFTKGLGGSFIVMGTYLLWFAQKILKAHLELIKHFYYSHDWFNPTDEIERMERQVGKR